MGFSMLEKVLEIRRGEPLGEGLELEGLVRTHSFRGLERGGERERE